MNNNITILVDVNEETTLELSVEDAKTLYESLKEIFGSETDEVGSNSSKYPYGGWIRDENVNKNNINKNCNTSPIVTWVHDQGLCDYIIKTFGNKVGGA